MNNFNLRIARIRHFYDFESINVVKHKQEITFYYDGSQTEKLQYFAPDFKEFLNVFDYNGEQLQFHAELSDYFDLGNNSITPIDDAKKQNENNEEIYEEKDGFKILIDFPKERPLLQNDFRTIIFEDKIDYPVDKIGSPFYISVAFDEASHTYLYINKLPHYNATIEKFFFSRNELDKKSGIPRRFFELEESEEKEFFVHYETRSYYCIASLVPVTDCDIFIIIEYHLRTKDSVWLYSGILIGLLAASLNAYLITNILSSSLAQITSISTITITYLVVIKGWVFTKDLDDVVTLIPTDLKFKLRFSDVYLVLILAIFIELVLAFYFGCMDQQNNYERIQIIIVSLYQNIFKL
jgi:hypothetical protein